VQVSGGELMGGEILIDGRAGSMSQTYDAAGNVIERPTTDGSNTFTQL
jgi:YD repeat-containing protein